MRGNEVVRSVARVPFIAPQFPESADIAIDYRSIVVSNRFSNFGPFEQRFRSQLANFVAPDAQVVTFSSATTALQATVLACFDGPLDGRRLVLMPSFTFAAAAQIVTTLGYQPLFVDLEIEGLHADPEAGAHLIDRHRAEIAGIMFGNSFGVGAHTIASWENLAREHALPLIIDSAAGFGSRYEDGSRLGLRGVCEVFSFHATKPLAIGEGGAITTRDVDLAHRLRQISNFGFDDQRVAVLPGLNGKLAELPSAIGLRQLARLDAVIGRRAEVLACYRSKIAELVLPRNIERSSLGFVSALLPDVMDRDSVISELSRRGIEARSYYAPSLHRSPQFSQLAELPCTEQVDRHVLSLPSHDGVSTDVVEEIAAVIRAGGA